MVGTNPAEHTSHKTDILADRVRRRGVTLSGRSHLYQTRSEARGMPANKSNSNTFFDAIRDSCAQGDCSTTCRFRGSSGTGVSAFIISSMAASTSASNSGSAPSSSSSGRSSLLFSSSGSDDGFAGSGDGGSLRFFDDFFPLLLPNPLGVSDFESSAAGSIGAIISAFTTSDHLTLGLLCMSTVAIASL
eukprot:g7309.t1